MEHCHNTVHEDNAMLLRWDIENAGQLKPFLTPEPQWNGCAYAESGALPAARALDETGNTRSEDEVGNPKSKRDFFKRLTLSEALCPPGATSECPGAENAEFDPPDPLSPPASSIASGSPSVSDSTASSVSPSETSSSSEPLASVGVGDASEEKSMKGKRSGGKKKKKKKRKGRTGRRAGKVHR